MNKQISLRPLGMTCVWKKIMVIFLPFPFYFQPVLLELSVRNPETKYGTVLN